MRRNQYLSLLTVLLCLGASSPLAAQTEEVSSTSRETDCTNRADDDGDGLTDCADADCFEHGLCEAGGATEGNNERCSDWIDNDGDSAVDCDDDDCSGPGITVCQGSWEQASTQPAASTAAGSPNEENSEEVMPELTGDMTVEDLIGRGGDIDGERNDYLCSDGFDNDGDGRVDCQDFGCRFDRSVSVCQDGSDSFRFSVVAGIGANLDLQADAGEMAEMRFTRLQLRALGQIPMIQNSFFLLSMRVERSPRLTFAHFQIPIGDSGHWLAINSGQGGLSSGLIVSTSKQPLLDAPFYLYRAFEQGAGAAVEVGGPVTDNGRLNFRLFAAGGNGEFNGNVGGRFFRGENENFAYTVGGQLQVNLIGNFSRFDSPFLYTRVPLGLGMLLGVKYDQRPRERYPAANAFLIFKWGRLLARAEAYTKYDLDYGAMHTAWNTQLSALIVPRTLMFAADMGGFYAGEFDETPEFDASYRRPLGEFQWRAALHWYWYRNIGILSLLFSETRLERNPERPADPILERELRLEAQFRF